MGAQSSTGTLNHCQRWSKLPLGALETHISHPSQMPIKRWPKTSKLLPKAMKTTAFATPVMYCTLYINYA